MNQVSRHSFTDTKSDTRLSLLEFTSFYAAMYIFMYLCSILLIINTMAEKNERKWAKASIAKDENDPESDKSDNCDTVFI